MSQDLLDQVVLIAQRAGEGIIDIYNSNDFAVEQKNDDGYVSPLTRADKTSHRIIIDRLKKISELPIISEEGKGNYQTYDQFWLVDPLDGTKDFINKNGEFTVNIALVKDKQPVLGVVYAPAVDKLYASYGVDTYKLENSSKTKLVQSSNRTEPSIVVSRNHKGEKLQKILEKFGPHNETDVGSSLKFCLLAEGTADVYPRYVQTYLWDTAAADAILRASGGKIRSFDGQKLIYDPRANIKNPLFIATSSGQDELFDKFINLSTDTDNI